jgi:hypothetical protein
LSQIAKHKRDFSADRLRFRHELIHQALAETPTAMRQAMHATRDGESGYLAQPLHADGGAWPGQAVEQP